MTYTMVPVILLGVIILGGLLAGSFRLHVINKERNHLLEHFKRLGARNQLGFSKVDILNATIIGLDDEQGMLLVVKKKAARTFSRLINLTDIKSCLLEQQYSLLHAHPQKGSRRDQMLEKVILHIRPHEGAPLKVTFYDHLKDPVLELTRLAGKAKHWEVMLSRLVAPERMTA